VCIFAWRVCVRACVCVLRIAFIAFSAVETISLACKCLLGVAAQVAVVGDQSSGKSSVLESISGIPFPRGTGLVTRCPTQLTLKRTAPGTQWTATASVSWCERINVRFARTINLLTHLSTCPRVRVMRRPHAQPAAAGMVSRPEELTNVIERLTTVLTAEGDSSFSSHAIHISVSSPTCPDLSLTDLPGIVRTHTQGQRSSVIDEVNTLIETYICQENTVILAVVPANQVEQWQT
jgi:interferon-induced GTP-binding protein Mx1